MAKLKHRRECYGGFFFRDPQINGEQQLQDWAHNTLCQRIQSQRLANPRFQLATDMPTIEAQVDDYQVKRLISLGPRVADQYVDYGGSPAAPSFQPAASPRPHLSAVAGQVGRVIKNMTVLTDWLGKGGTPVEKLLANERAHVCSQCPKNQVGDLAKWFLIPAANAIRRALEARKDLKLETALDEKLGVCDVCLCSNRLKIWTPIEHVKEKTPPEVLVELKTVVNPAGGCWVVKEMAG